MSILSRRTPKADIYNRRHDGVVLIDKQQAIKIQSSSEGSPTHLWNNSILGKLELSKQEVLTELSRAATSGNGSVAWES